MESLGLDTIKIGFPLTAIAHFDWRSAPHKTIVRMDETGQEFQFFRSNKRSPESGYGAFIETKPDFGQGIMEISAKTLYDRYPEGLTSANIDYALDRIEQINEISFNRPVLLGTAQVFRADVAANVEPPTSIPVTISAAKAVLSWSHKKNDFRFGDAFLLYNKTEEFAIYDKESETSARDPKLYKICGGQFANTLRCEYRGKKTVTIAQRYGVGLLTYETVARGKRSGRMDERARSRNAPEHRNSVLYLGEALEKKNHAKALLESWDSLTIHDAGRIDLSTIEMILKNPLPLEKIMHMMGRVHFFRDVCGCDETILISVIAEKCKEKSHRRVMKKRIMDSWRLLEQTAARAQAIIEDVRERMGRLAA